MLGLNVSYLKYILLGVLLYGLVLVVNNKLLANNEVQTDGFEEKDSKLDTIVTKLDTIVTKLDNINNSINNEDDYGEDDEEDDDGEDDDEEDDDEDEDNSGGTNVDGFKPKNTAKSLTQKNNPKKKISISQQKKKKIPPPLQKIPISQQKKKKIPPPLQKKIGKNLSNNNGQNEGFTNYTTGVASSFGGDYLLLNH